MEKEYRVIKRIRLANYLSNHGIYFEYSRVDYNNPKYKVFVYKITPEFLQCVEEYYKELEAIRN